MRAFRESRNWDPTWQGYKIHSKKKYSTASSAISYRLLVLFLPSSGCRGCRRLGPGFLRSAHVQRAALDEQVAQEVVVAGLQDVYLLLQNGVAILVEKSVTLIIHHIGKMLDDEDGLAEPRLGKVLPLLALVVEFLHPGLVRPLGHSALLVQKIQDPQLALDQINAGLVVVEVDHLPVDSLLDVFFLFKFENVLRK